MVETIRYSPVYREDLAIGNGRREEQLADGRVVLLREVNLGTLLLTQVTRHTPTAAGQLTISGLYPAKCEAWGTTIRILSSLGASSGLTSFDVGYSNDLALWGANIDIIQTTETSAADFTLSDKPIFASATNILLTANGGNFDTVGLIEVESHYLFISHVGLG